MRIELGAPVVLRLQEPGHWHLPAAGRETLDNVEISLDEGLRRISARWPTLCDSDEPGELFVYGGYVRRRRCCPDCLALAPREHLIPDSERRERQAREERFAA